MLLDSNLPVSANMYTYVAYSSMPLSIVIYSHCDAFLLELKLYVFITTGKCLCPVQVNKNAINQLCVGPSVPVCSCINDSCQVM